MYRFDDRIRRRRQEAVAVVRAGIGFDFVPRLPWNSVQISGEGEQLPTVMEREPDDRDH
jgi:hypothetical protein